ncbi:MAG: NAD-dependent epimerase/dehydratase family protein [Nanoarchaeota archaeon]
MSKFLVTGGAGFIGSNLVGKLLSLNHEVVVLDNLCSGYKKNLEEFNSRFEFYEEDIRNFELVKKLIKQVDCVFHLAAMVSVPESVEKPFECIDVNVRASLNIIKECLKNNVKFVFASSAAVYGDDTTNIKTEDLKTIPISPYGLSKFDVERFCKIYEKDGLNFTCFRNFNVYGPKQDFNSAYSAVIPSFIQRVLSKKNLKIFGDGTQTRDFIFVDDVVNAYILAFNENIRGIFNLGCNEILNLKDLSFKILSISNACDLKVEFYDARKGDVKHSRASSQKFISESSWRANVGIDEGLQKTFNYYKNFF